MIRTRVRKILRDVWARKGRTFLVSAAIFVGVAGTVALFSMSDIIIRQLREDVKEEELAMVQVSVVAEEGAQLDNAAYLQMLNQFPGVTEVMGGMEEFPIYFKLKEGDEEFEDGFIQAYTVWDGNEENPALLTAPFEVEAPIEPMRLLQEGDRNEKAGRWPEAGQNELLVEQRMAEEYDLRVGDTLVLRIPSPSRVPEQNGATGTTETWTVSGIVFDAYSLSPKVSVYTDLANAGYLTNLTGFNDFLARFTDFPTAEDSFQAFQDTIANDTPYDVVFSQIEDPAENALITTAQLFTNLMSFLALVALIVSGFLVVNVVTSLVTEQKQQIGIMKSLGATRADNLKIYSGIAFAYGVVGVVPGVILGIPAGDAAAKALSSQVNTVLEGFNISLPSIILGVVVGLLVPVLASLIPVFAGTRVRILDAITDLGIGANYGSGLLARLIGKLPVPITVRQGLSNVSLKKSRLAFTVITLAIAVGAFMGIYAIFASMTSGIQSYIDSFNVQIGIGPTQPVDPDRFETILLESFEEDIETLEPGFMAQVEFEGYEAEISSFGPPGIFAYGYDVESDDPAFLFTIDEGKELTIETAATGIILSSALAANMDKDVGDTVVLQVPGNTREFTVVGISEYPLDQCWLHWETLAEVTDYTVDTIISASSILSDAIPPEVSGFVKYATLVKVDGYSSDSSFPGVLVMGFAPSVGAYLTFEDGDFFSADQPGIIISQAMAQNGGYSVGDLMSLTSMTPDGAAAEYPIVGIFEPPTLFMGGAGEAPAGGFELPPDYVGMFWRDLTALDGAEVTSKLRPQMYFVTTPDDEASADDVDDLGDTINDELLGHGIPIFSFNFVQLTDEISQGFFRIQAILSAVAGLIALVGALGLLTTLSMSVFERQKEIGVMRSIGAGSSTVAIQFLTEGMVVGVIAWLVGLPFMLLLQLLLLQIIGPEIFPLEISPAAILVGLIGMIIITTIASLWPSLGAARKTVSDILRYQ